MAHVPKNPHIALREGVSPSCLALPRMKSPPWRTVLDHLVERLAAIGAAEWRERMAQGNVLNEAGEPVSPDTPFVGGARIYYWRQLAAEPEIPFQETVLFQDEHLVVADKPHFLPVTPGGRYVQQTLLVRLKRRLGLADLSPLHRIDRETAGLVVFSVRPPDRDAYQRLFRERRVAKTYQALAPWSDALPWPQTRTSHLKECEDAFYKMRESRPEEGLPPNSETRIHRLERHGRWARYHLEPVTGQRHQLRVHMQALGLPIAGDQFYPVVKRQAGETEDFAEPLRLLAQTIAFTDPLTGAWRHFESQRTLTWPAD
jgi:tRNA pseudouridine32 synthase / 23S rRNA pseudouridine746 synthase